MLSRILLIISLIITSISAQLFAQDGRKGYIGITVGLSTPIGDFSDNSMNNLDAGYATSGASVNLANFGYKFINNFGITASWYGGAHIFENEFGDNGLWSYGGIMVGPLLSFPLGRKFDLDFRAMYGYISATIDLPDFDFKETGAGSAFNIGTSLRFSFVKRMSLIANLEYFNAEPDISVVGKKKITTINANVGIAYNFLN